MAISVAASARTNGLGASGSRNPKAPLAMAWSRAARSSSAESFSMPEFNKKAPAANRIGWLAIRLRPMRILLDALGARRDPPSTAAIPNLGSSDPRRTGRFPNYIAAVAVEASSEEVFGTLSPTVLVTDYAWPSLEIERAALASIGAELVAPRGAGQDELIKLAAGADAILTNWKPVSDRMLEAATRCITVARYGVGVDNIDVERATELGIVVCNVPDYCVDEVSDHTIALLLALARRIVDFARQTSAGQWDNQAFGTPRRLRGRTLGLVGFGRIARLVAEKAQGIGLQVLAFAPNLSPGDHDGVHATRTLEELLECSEMVSLHAPLTSETRHLIGANQLARMRPGAMLINTARGGLLDLEAARAALLDGRLSALGLDVLDEEPPRPDNPILTTPGVVVTPHAAFYSEEAIAELQHKAVTNVIDALSGTPPATVVNPTVLASPALRLRNRPDSDAHDRTGR